MCNFEEITSQMMSRQWKKNRTPHFITSLTRALQQSANFVTSENSCRFFSQLFLFFLFRPHTQETADLQEFDDDTFSEYVAKQAASIDDVRICLANHLFLRNDSLLKLMSENSIR